MKEPKYKIGDRVRDTLDKKVGIVSAVIWDVGDSLNTTQWYYSIDRMGWLFIKEEELEVVK